ncbi:MAG: hypothetical protein LBD16_04075 [Oscillospiraceae bacterium]|jgi:hypothetical protein|nr:hypothetical protein [Oscillospiraceae bacterium]
MDLRIPFNSVGGDRTYDADDIARMFACVVTNGVHPMPGDCLMVMAGGGFTVNLRPGSCVINGRLGVNAAAKQLTLDAPDANLPRVDSVVLRLDTLARDITEAVLAGTPAQNPTPAALTRDGDIYELCAAQILIAPQSEAIYQSAITDTRHDASLCGICTSLIEADATDLFAQYDAAFNDWFAGLTDLLDENAAAQMAAQISAIEQKQTKGVFEEARFGGVVPPSVWQLNEETGLWQADVESAFVYEASDVSVTLAPESLTQPVACSGEAMNGAFRMYAFEQPSGDVAFTAVVQKVG